MSPSAALPPGGPIAVDGAPGVHRITLAIPFGVRTVNVWLLEGAALTLVDCGTNSATVLAAVEDALAELGHRVEDLDRIVVTHHHIDHIGLAGALQRRSGAELCCLDLAAPMLADWDAAARRDDDDAHEVMLRHGVEAQVADALRAVAGIARAWGAASHPDRLLRDGDRLAMGDADFEVHHRPGHSSTDVLLLDPATGLALTGDHLLADISSNAVLARPIGETGPPLRRPQPLVEYRRSLRATRELDLRLGLGGHGREVTGHRDLIDARLAEHERRALEMLETLGPEPRTAHELATDLFGPTAITQVFLTLSEVLGHLDLLAADGLVEEDRSQRLIRFQRR